MSLFTLRLSRRIELRTRDTRIAEFYGVVVPPLILQRGEQVDVLDVFAEGFYCDTRHGRAFLRPDALKPERKKA